MSTADLRRDRRRLRHQRRMGGQGADRGRAAHAGAGAGRPVAHVKDYPTARLDPWELPYGNRATQQDLKDYPIQSQLSFLFGQDVKHFLVKDVDHPYEPIKPFRWFRGYQVGGRSLLWARHCFRWSDLDFEANARKASAIDWPIRYADIAPWYDHVEAFIGVSGENAGLPQLPDGQAAAALRDELHRAAPARASRRRSRAEPHQQPRGRADPAAQRPRRLPGRGTSATAAVPTARTSRATRRRCRRRRRPAA